jgi:hypothetical protein
MTDKFNAFAEAQSISLGDLTIESDEERLAIYGKLNLMADAASLATLDRLVSVLLQARKGLVDGIAKGDQPPPKPPALPSVKNPFA